MPWIERLCAVTEQMVERSRQRTASNAVFDLEPGHTAAAPRLRRLLSPVEQHPLYWEVQARVANHDPRCCPVPPDQSGGYCSIFALRQGERDAG
jgi:ectoine hydroxylase